MTASTMQPLPTLHALGQTAGGATAALRDERAAFLGWRESTTATRAAAVHRVIHEIQQRLDEPLSLHDMAEIAYLSAFHFNRVFRQMTGVSPCRFLTSLRMDAAKRYLRTSDMRVTDICFAVGYNSLGTFTTQFTQHVGLSPGRYRRLERGATPARSRHRFAPAGLGIASRPGGAITGWVDLSDPSPFWIFVGLFPTPVPSGTPAACALLTGPGLFHLAPVADGSYYLRAAAMARSDDPLLNPAIDEHVAYVGSNQDRIVINRGRLVEGSARLRLRPVDVMDPPVLVVLPFLLSQHQPAI
jgi:AraC-like DNA-binding protein